MTAHAGPANQNDGKFAAPATGLLVLLLRIFALTMVAVVFSFLINNWLTFWRGWPGALTVFSNGAGILVWVQLGIYLLPMVLVVGYVVFSPGRTMHADAGMLTGLTNYIVRAAFWAVLLVGLADAVISFLRVEGLLKDIVGKQLASDLGRSSFRGDNVHYPLMAFSLFIALFIRSLGFYWLTLLVVLAEIQIVLSRFIFSYEQAFMADLVRFWYGALFLFASAYTLVKEGHVRVDILYAGFSKRGKAWTNVLGSLLLGLPLCWVVLTMGMWGRADIINGPLLNYEVTQAGFGLYVKYLLAGFLLIFALTMLIQFMSYLLMSAAILLRAPGYDVAIPKPTMAGPASAQSAEPRHQIAGG